MGAPVSYHLAGDWASKMSLGQGADYFKYHQGQHGGEAPLSSIGQGFLSADMAGPARTASIDHALNEIQGMKDQAGGRRRRKSKKQQYGKRRSHYTRKSRCKRKSHRRCRHRGGSLGFAPLSSNSMLLDQAGYARAGLNPEWKSNVEFTDAAIRNQL
jgi:hypothetical protein